MFLLSFRSMLAAPGHTLGGDERCSQMPLGVPLNRSPGRAPRRLSSPPHPYFLARRDKALGAHTLHLTRTLYIERDDFREVDGAWHEARSRKLGSAPPRRRSPCPIFHGAAT